MLKLEEPLRSSTVDSDSLGIALLQKKSRLFEEVVLKSWWVILFVFLAVFAYEQASLDREKEKKTLLLEVQNLQESIKAAEIREKELELQAKSQEESQWIEMVLMKGLGLVPEGAIKIHFQ